MSLTTLAGKIASQQDDGTGNHILLESGFRIDLESGHESHIIKE